MTIEYCRRCDVCGERTFVNWNMQFKQPSDAPGWFKFTILWGSNGTNGSTYEMCPDCANAIRDGKTAIEGQSEKLVRIAHEAPSPNLCLCNVAKGVDQ